MAKEATKSEQFDAPWELAVERFLRPLLQLGFPAVHDSIDWCHAPEFLDTELQELGTEHAQGGRTVDKLVKVRRLDGRQQWLFIHLEIQAQPDTRFPHRIWVYYYRLCDKRGEGVVSLAILADAQPNWRPHCYETEIAGCRLRLELRFRSESATLPPSEGHMTTELITPWEEMALEEGLAKGRVEGLVEGLLNALGTRFGAVPEGVRDRFKQVSDESRLRQAMRLAVTEPTLERFLAEF